MPLAVVCLVNTAPGRELRGSATRQASMACSKNRNRAYPHQQVPQDGWLGGGGGWMNGTAGWPAALALQGLAPTTVALGPWIPPPISRGEATAQPQAKRGGKKPGRLSRPVTTTNQSRWWLQGFSSLSHWRRSRLSSTDLVVHTAYAWACLRVRGFQVLRLPQQTWLMGGLLTREHRWCRLSSVRVRGGCCGSRACVCALGSWDFVWDATSVCAIASQLVFRQIRAHGTSCFVLRTRSRSSPHDVKKVQRHSCQIDTALACQHS